MQCSLELAIKQIILTHYRNFKQPVGKKELEDMVQQVVCSGFTPVGFASILQKLKDGKAICEEPANFFTPNYERVEM